MSVLGFPLTCTFFFYGVTSNTESSENLKLLTAFWISSTIRSFLFNYIASQVNKGGVMPQMLEQLRLLNNNFSSLQ